MNQNFNNKNNFGLPVELKKDKTLADGISEFNSKLEIRGNIRESTLKRSYEPIQKKLKHHLGPDWILMQTTVEDCERFLSQYNNKLHMKRLAFSISKKMFSEFLMFGYVVFNPFDYIKKPVPAEKEITIIPDDHFQMILDNLLNPIIKDAVMCLRYTGARPGEVLNLMKRNYHSANETSLVNFGNDKHTTKTKNSRLVPVPDELKSILERNCSRFKDYNSYIFSKDGRKSYTVSSVSKAFKKACRELNLPETYHLYNLRATYASSLINKKIPMWKVSKILGHSELRTTEKYYTRFDMTDFGDVLEILNNNNNGDKQNDGSTGIAKAI